MIILISIIGILTIIYYLKRDFRKTGKYITIFNLFSIFTLIDIYIPAITGNIEGKYYALNYVHPITDAEVVISVIITYISYFLIRFGYKSIKTMQHKFVQNKLMLVKKKYFFFFFIISITIYLLNLWFEYRSLGSWIAFYDYKIARIYAVTVESSGTFQNVIHVLSETTFITLLMLLSIAIYFGHYFSKNEKRIIFIFSVLISILSLSRGTILCLFICIVASIENSKFSFSVASFKKNKKNLKLCIVAGIIFFLIFGGIRNYLQNDKVGEGNKGLINNTLTAFNNTLGSSLIGLTRTIRYVDEGNKLFYGQSYAEMFLSLIPRSFLPSKPQVYGVATLTIAEGSPTTTMDAITIPGEAIMNFGYFGLFVLVIWGISFKIIDNLRFYSRLRFFYMAVIFSLASTSTWMSFTGFFAQTKYIIIYFIILKFTLKYKI